MRTWVLALFATSLLACGGSAKVKDDGDGGNHIEFDVQDLASPSEDGDSDDETTVDLKKPKKDLTAPDAAEPEDEPEPDLAMTPTPADLATQPTPSPDLLTNPEPADMTSGACPHYQFNPYTNDKEWALWKMKGTTPQLAITSSLLTVVDGRTGLEWQRATATNGGAKYDDTEAMAYCDDLVLDGKNDWRLPTLAEALSIVKFDQFPAPTISQSAFPNSEEGPYWTSTMTNGIREFVNLKNGTTESTVYKASARCVRVTCTGASLPNPQYQTVAGTSGFYSGSVLDRYTGLEWRESISRSDNSYLSYDSASKAQLYCAGLGGGWRLPTVEEAVTLFKPFTAYGSAKIDGAFGLPSSHEIWAADGRVVSFYNANIYATSSSSSIYARCVR